jgi:hypothetical protein
MQDKHSTTGGIELALAVALHVAAAAILFL